MTNKSNHMIDNITSLISDYLTLNESTEINSLNMYVNYEKNNVSALKTLINIQDGQVNLPSFCELLANVPNTDCQNKIITQKA